LGHKTFVAGYWVGTQPGIGTHTQLHELPSHSSISHWAPFRLQNTSLGPPLPGVEPHLGPFPLPALMETPGSSGVATRTEVDLRAARLTTHALDTATTAIH